MQKIAPERLKEIISQRLFLCMRDDVLVLRYEDFDNLAFLRQEGKYFILQSGHFVLNEIKNFSSKDDAYFLQAHYNKIQKLYNEGALTMEIYDYPCVKEFIELEPVRIFTIVNEIAFNDIASATQFILGKFLSTNFSKNIWFTRTRLTYAETEFLLSKYRFLLEEDKISPANGLWNSGGIAETRLEITDNNSIDDFIECQNKATYNAIP